MADEQVALFNEANAETTADSPLNEARPPLDAEATLMAAVLAYQAHMERENFSPHTVKAFGGDLRLLQNFMGPDILVHQLGTDELNQFLYWLQYERGVPCSSKTYARRVTTLKSFFSWLTAIRVLPFDPAAKLIHLRVTTPLPTVLNDEEVDRLLEATTELAQRQPKADPRPHLLVNILLQTGIKKAECMRLTPQDFEDDDPQNPTLYVRYSDPRYLHKERRIAITSNLFDILDQYLEVYQPNSRIFECTPRNLEYVLRDSAESASVSKGASFETLRWTAALRDYRDDAKQEKLRDKLGLSKVTWRETTQKLDKLLAAQSDQAKEEAA